MEGDRAGSDDRNNGKGRRQPTMADLAAHLGVSRQLVSIVLRDAPGASEETRRRVRAAAEEYGFAAHAGAQSLRRTRSRDLGVVFAPAHSTEPEIVEAIYPAAVSHGYNVILSAHTDTRSTHLAVEELLAHRCAALILIGSDLSHAGLIEVAQQSHVPVVDVGYGRRNDSYDVVRSTGDRGIEEMVHHLAGLGHRDIAYVDARSMPMATLRRRGYDRAVKKLGLTRDVTSGKGDYTQSNYFEEVGAEAGTGASSKCSNKLLTSTSTC